MQEPSSSRTEEFLRLLAEHERKLGLYVSGLIACPHDAQDILQEGKLVMWHHFDQFESGTNFAAWGRRILFHQILAWRRKSKRRSEEFLSDRTLELLSTEAENAIREGRWERREKALNACLRKMKDEHRSIIQMRYRDESSIGRIAHRVQKTEGAIYRMLSRLRQILFECVERELKSP